MARRSRSYQRRQERRATIGRKEAGLSAREALEATGNVAAKNVLEIACASTVFHPLKATERPTLWARSNWSMEVCGASMRSLLNWFSARGANLIPTIMERKRRSNQCQFSHHFLSCLSQISRHLMKRCNSTLNSLFSKHQPIFSALLMLRHNICFCRYIMRQHMEIFPTRREGWWVQKIYHLKGLRCIFISDRLSMTQKFVLESEVSCTQASITEKCPGESLCTNTLCVQLSRPLVRDRPPSCTENERSTEEGRNTSYQSLPMVQPLPKWILQMCRRCRQSRGDLARICAGRQLPLQRGQSLAKEWPCKQQEHRAQYEKGQFNAGKGRSDFLHALNLQLDRASMQAELAQAGGGV